MNRGRPRAVVKTFGEVIREYREEIKMTQAQLAEKIGISAGYLAKIELDYTLPSSDELIGKLAEALGLDVATMLKEVHKQRVYRGRSVVSMKNIISILQLLPSIMDESTIDRTIKRVDRRIGEFDENKKMLAENVARFLTGDLQLNQKPDNGLRPLSHYIADWGTEIEEW